MERSVEDVSGKGLRAWQAGAQASVLVAIVALTMSGMIAVACCFSIVAVGTSPSVDDAAYVAAMAEALMYWDDEGLPAGWRCLVYGCVLGGTY